MEIIGWLLVAALLILGAPLYAALGLGSAFIMVFVHGLPWSVVAQQWIMSANSWPLLAMPLFTLAGHLMLNGGSARRLLDAFDNFFGHLAGGLLVVAVGFCALFGALSGSGYAAIAAVGTIMFPEFRKYGYTDTLATGVVGVTGDLGILIPPSMLFIIIAMLMQISAASLFAAGMVPGLILAVLYGIVGIFLARRQGVKRKAPVDWKTRWQAGVRAIPAAFMPVIILGGIYTGFFTPTEAAAVSCAYAVVVGVAVYRAFTWGSFVDAFLKTARMSATMYIMIGSIGIFSYIVNISGAPVALTNIVVDMQLSPTIFALAFSVVFVMLGFVFNPISLTFILMPVLLDTFMAQGVSLLWIGTLFCIGTMIGTFTPPMC
ncbi:MAG: TRAP transporter large permease, partial [Deltaproteobacteria bacterium]|nr:TRAP transporter large permease [Deltaproteobacteria bacterium]